MRIAYIVAVFPVPSETFVAREVLAMISRGFEVDVFAVRKPNSEQVKNLSSEARALVARVKYLSRSELALAAPFAALQLEARELNDRLACSNSKSRSSLRMLRAAAIARHVNAGGYDRVHAHWPYATQLAMLVHAMTRVPLSASVHAHEVVHENGHFELAFERLEFASFCNAAAMAKLQTTLGGEAASRCHLIYHGVNLSQFAPSALPSLASGLRVLSAGRLTPTKGFDRLLRAVAGARALGADVRLTIAGEGALRADLESLARELTIGDAVTFRGWVQHSEMPSLIANSHVFALMANTEFHDGLPNVVLESMACGRPVVLSPLPAADEAVVTGESGFLLSTSDAEDECAERLVELAQGAGTLERMGAKARDIARTRFDEDSCMDQLAELFAEGHPSQHNMVRSRVLPE